MKEQDKLKWPDCLLWFQLGLKDNSGLEFQDAPLDCHVGNYGFTKTGMVKTCLHAVRLRLSVVGIGFIVPVTVIPRLVTSRRVVARFMLINNRGCH